MGLDEAKCTEKRALCNLIPSSGRLNDDEESFAVGIFPVLVIARNYNSSLSCSSSSYKEQFVTQSFQFLPSVTSNNSRRRQLIWCKRHSATRSENFTCIRLRRLPTHTVRRLFLAARLHARIYALRDEEKKRKTKSTPATQGSVQDDSDGFESFPSTKSGRKSFQAFSHMNVKKFSLFETMRISKKKNFFSHHENCLFHPPTHTHTDAHIHTHKRYFPSIISCWTNIFPHFNL